jgi:release factor glutamine methyltransferase
MLPELLVRGGVALIVHSTLCDEEQTVAHLREHRLKAAVIARQTVRFGPVMRARARRLEEAGVIGAGQRHEELVVVRADRVDP